MREALLARYREREPLLRGARDRLEGECLDVLAQCVHVDRIYFRIKSAKSFVEKALDPRNEPEYSDPLLEIEDQIAGRVLVFCLSDIPPVLHALSNAFQTVESSSRRPERDESFGYESEHRICVIPPHVQPDGWSASADMPRTFELQVRTLFMHAYAEPQHDLAYKAVQELPSRVRRELAWIAASAWGADQAYERVRQWNRAAVE
jgi:putative GTP pyrophosphokinase